MLEQTFARPAPIQAIDPRVRLLCALFAAVCMTLLTEIDSCCLGLCLSAPLLALSRPPLGGLLRRLLAVNLFLALFWCFTPWTTPGTPYAALGPCVITREGLTLALVTSLKVNALACLFLALAGSMAPGAAAHALADLGLPDKLVFLLLLAARDIHLLFAEWNALRVAAALRGFRPRCDLHTYRTLASLLGLLLVRGHDRACRVHEAMLLRAFSGKFTSIATYALRPVDILFVVVLTLCLALLVIADKTGGIRV